MRLSTPRAVVIFAVIVVYGCEDQRITIVPNPTESVRSPPVDVPPVGRLPGDENRPPPSGCQDAKGTIEVDPESAPIDFVFYVDRSGSMAKRVEGPGGAASRYALTMSTLSSVVATLDPAYQVAIQMFPGGLRAPAVDPLPSEALGFCAECTRPSCAFEACQVDSECASGLCRGSLCVCNTRRVCNSGFTCAERFCDRGPPMPDLAETLLSGDLQGQIAACVGPNECWDLRDDREAQCRSFGETFRDPQRGGQQLADCSPEAYRTPTVGLTSDADQLSTAIAAIAAIGPGGDTPLGPALAGARAFVEEHRAAFPARRVAQIIMTDGEPTDCDSLGPVEIRRILADTFGAAGIFTFVVGVFEADAAQIADMHVLAQAGGTDQALVVHPGSDFAAEFARALSRIEQTVASCEWSLPAGTDPDALDLDLHFPEGSDERLRFVVDQAECNAADDGWYFDAAPTSGRAPRSVRLCPDVCDRVRAGALLRFKVTCGVPSRNFY